MEITIELFVDLLRADGSIVVNKKLAKNIGLEEAVLYSDLLSKYVYFKERNLLTDDGFFFNTAENIEKDTSLTYRRQNSYLKKLEKIHLIETSVRGLPARKYFKINKDTSVLIKYLSMQENQQYKQNVDTGINNLLKVAETKCLSNNTNLNNPNFNNNNLYKVSSQKGLTATVKETNKNLFTPEALRLFEFFENKYFGINFTSHPPIDNDTIEKFNHLVESGELYDNKMNTDRCVDYDGLKEMINLYFDTKYELRTGGYADHRIWHFLSENVLVNLFYNCGLL